MKIKAKIFLAIGIFGDRYLCQTAFASGSTSPRTGDGNSARNLPSSDSWMVFKNFQLGSSSIVVVD